MADPTLPFAFGNWMMGPDGSPIPKPHYPYVPPEEQAIVDRDDSSSGAWLAEFLANQQRIDNPRAGLGLPNINYGAEPRLINRIDGTQAILFPDGRLQVVPRGVNKNPLAWGNAMARGFAGLLTGKASPAEHPWDNYLSDMDRLWGVDEKTSAFNPYALGTKNEAQTIGDVSVRSSIFPELLPPSGAGGGGGGPDDESEGEASPSANVPVVTDSVNPFPYGSPEWHEWEEFERNRNRGQNNENNENNEGGGGPDKPVVPPVVTGEEEGGGEADMGWFLQFLRDMGYDEGDANIILGSVFKDGAFDPDAFEAIWPMISAQMQTRENERTQPSVEEMDARLQREQAHELTGQSRGYAFNTQDNFANREHQGRIAQLGNEQAYGTAALQNIGAADVQRLQNYGTTIAANRAMSTPEGYASYIGDSENPAAALSNYQAAQIAQNTGGIGVAPSDALMHLGNQQDQARALAYIQATGGLLGAGGVINPELAQHQQNLQRMQSTGGYSNPYDFMMTERLQAVNNPYAWLEYQGMKDQMMADRTAWQDQYGQMGQQNFGEGNVRDLMFRDGAPAYDPNSLDTYQRAFQNRVAQPEVSNDGGLSALNARGMLRWIPGNYGYDKYQAAMQARQNRADTQANQWFTMATPPAPPEVVTTNANPAKTNTKGMNTPFRGYTSEMEREYNLGLS